MGELLETSRLLRSGGYGGYLHVKILPGAARSDIEEAARLASRISINIETTGPSHLRALSGIKDYEQDLRKRMAWVAEAKPGSHTTQLVVGAAGETDAEILSCLTDLYRTVHPSRIYYSAFRALPKTKLASRSSTPEWRTKRLYQMDYLMREYGMQEEDLRLAVRADGTLADADPKEILAQGMTKIDPNIAPYEDLIRVPGIGPVTAREITGMQERRQITPADIGAGRLISRRAAPFLSIVRETGRQVTLAGF
jgi:predicted DNA-binding helix-hairpin-helix protein